MATIKKGTYRWNDELTDLGYTTEISIPFTVPPYVEIDDASVDAINSEITSANLDVPLLEYGITTSFVCNSIRFYKNGSSGYYIVEHGIESYTYSSDNPALNLILGESREKISEVYHSGSDGVVSGFNNGYLQYLTVLEDTVVEDEAFATWFNNNTKEVKAISGKRRFKETIYCHPYETYQIREFSYEDKIEFLKTYGALCEPIDLSSIQEGLFFNCFSIGNTFGDLFVDGQPTSLNEGCYIGVCNDGEYVGIGVIPIESIVGQTVDFGIEPQYVIVDAHDWIMENTESVAVEITYKGDKIELFAGETVTLHTEGCKLTEDLVIKANAGSGSSDANVVPLVVGVNGTYNAANAPTFVTETWTENSTFDAGILNYYGTYPLSYAKATKLVSDENALNLLLNPMCKVYINLGGEEATVTFEEFGYNNNERAFQLVYNNMPVAIWVKNADAFNSYWDITWAEENAVYVTNIFALLNVTGSVSITAPVKGETTADGFYPVTVALPIVEEEQIVIPNRDDTVKFNDGKYYANITVKPVDAVGLIVTPSPEEQTFCRDGRLSAEKFYWDVTVEAVDLTKMKLLCDLSIEVMPKTEYKVGEWLDTDAGRLLKHYTDGTTERTVMVNNYIISGWEKAWEGGAGTYTMVCQYTENGITCRVAYDITITEA